MRWLALFLTIWAGIIGALAAPATLQFAQSPPSWVIPGATVDFDFAHQRYWRGGALTAIDRILSYTRTNNETCQTLGGNLYYVAANTPCITDAGYQSWPANNNLLLQSQFAASWTATRSTLTPNVVVSPDGTVDAATLVEDSTATNTHFTTQTVVKAASAIPYEFSVYAKSNTRTRIALQLDDAAGNGAVMVCDLDHKTVGVNTAGVGTPFTTLSQIVYGYSNGWTRCAMTATSNTALAIVGTIFLDSGAGTAAISNSYSGNGASGVTIFGAQLQNLSSSTIGVPAPYVPTTTILATQSADCMSAGIGNPVGPQQTLYGAFTPATPVADNGAQEVLYIDDATANNRALIRRTAVTGVMAGILIIGGVTQYTLSPGAAMAQDVQSQIAMSMQPSFSTSSSNGSVVATSAAAPIILSSSNATTLHVGCSTTSAAQTQGTIQRVAILGNTSIGNVIDLTTRLQ